MHVHVCVRGANVCLLQGFCMCSNLNVFEVLMHVCLHTCLCRQRHVLRDGRWQRRGKGSSLALQASGPVEN